MKGMLDSHYYTIAETSALIGVRKETLKKRCQRGKIKNSKKIGGVWLIPIEYVHDKKIISAGLYVDGANMLHGGRNVCWLVDYTKLNHFISRRYNVKVMAYYDSHGYETKNNMPIKNEQGKLILKHSQQKFFNYLTGYGYRVTKKPLKFINGDHTQPKNNMDTFITVDIIKEMDLWDTLLLFSGDSDFDQVVAEVVAKGKKVHVFSFKSNLAYEIKQRAFHSPQVTFTVLDDLKTLLEEV